MNTTATCNIAMEGYPERSLNSGTGQFYMPFCSNCYSWSANATTTWNPFSTFPTSPGYYGNGDEWAAPGPGTDLDYASEMEYTSGGASWCIGVAATPPTDVDGGTGGKMTWQYPLSCVDLPHSGRDDGPSIYFDGGASSFFAAAYDTSRSAIVLYSMPTCNSGQPGVSGTACPISSANPSGTAIPLPDGACGLTVHPTVTVNPCTHDTIVAYHDCNSPRNIILGFFDSSGNHVTDYTVASVNWGSDSLCPPGSSSTNCLPKCTGNGSSDCGGLGGTGFAPKEHVSTGYTSSGSTCYALVSYDAHLRRRMASTTSNPGSPFSTLLMNQLQGASSSRRLTLPRLAVFGAAPLPRTSSWERRR